MPPLPSLTGEREMLSWRPWNARLSLSPTVSFPLCFPPCLSRWMADKTKLPCFVCRPLWRQWPSNALLQIYAQVSFCYHLSLIFLLFLIVEATSWTLGRCVAGKNLTLWNHSGKPYCNLCASFKCSHCCKFLDTICHFSAHLLNWFVSLHDIAMLIYQIRLKIFC